MQLTHQMLTDLDTDQAPAAAATEPSKEPALT